MVNCTHKHDKRSAKCKFCQLKDLAELKIGKPSPIKGIHRKAKEFICLYCGKSFWSHQPRKANKYCKFSCYVFQRREKAKVIGRFRSTKEYSNWAEMVKERDGKCIRCGKNTKLVAHHIIGISQDFSKALDESNGQALCYSCHNIVHNKVLNFFLKKAANSVEPRTGNPEPSMEKSKACVETIDGSREGKYSPAS